MTDFTSVEQHGSSDDTDHYHRHLAKFDAFNIKPPAPPKREIRGPKAQEGWDGM